MPGHPVNIVILKPANFRSGIGGEDTFEQQAMLESMLMARKSVVLHFYIYVHKHDLYIIYIYINLLCTITTEI